MENHIHKLFFKGLVCLSGAFLPFVVHGQASDTQAPATDISLPSSEGEILTGPVGGLSNTVSVVLDGTSADEVGGSGVDTVDLFIRSIDQNQWYNPITGLYSSVLTSPFIPVAVSQQQIGEGVDWTTTLDLPVGSYRVHVRTTDASGNVESPTTRRRFAVELDTPESTDIQEPVAVISLPSNDGENLMGQPGSVAGTVSVLLQGTASDEIGGSGVQNVELLMLSVDEGRWYNPVSAEFRDRWGGPVIPVTLTQQTSSETFDWSASVELPVGRYRVFARTEDNAGNIEVPIVRKSFRATTSDVQGPVSVITSPSSEGGRLTGVAGEFPGTISVLLQGTAADDVGGAGVQEVELLMRSLDFGQWYNPITQEYSNTSSNGPATVAALIQQGSSEIFDWSAQVNLPPGDFRVFLRAMDAAGNFDNPSPRRGFTVIDFWSPPPPPNN